MATKLFLRAGSPAVDVHLGTNNTKLNGSASAWQPRPLSTTAGSSINTENTATVAGATNGVEITDVSAVPYEWISLPVSADVTISGAVTGNIWAAEDNMSANVAINFQVDVIRATDNSIVSIVKSANVTEAAVTTRAVNNFTATPGAGVTVNRGDRLRIRIFGDDAGTMASGFNFSISYNAATGGADGDTFISFTETFGFETSAPAGTVLFLTDTASDVATASVDREAWTSRGAGVVNDVTNTAAGWTAPIQVTDTAGGTVVDWFTKQLTAFTLGGLATANLRALESATAANTSLRLELARVNSDGTSPTVWGSWCCMNVARAGELATTETAEAFSVSGDDLAFTDGQRIRIRVYLDDYPLGAMGASQTATLFYAGTSGGASGDTFVTLPQSVTEFVAAGVSGDAWINDRRTPRRRSMQRW